MVEVSARVNALVKRALETNARYYQGLFSLATVYLRDLSDLLADGRRPVSDRVVLDREPEHRAPVMVLEAEAGEHARGLFIVENKLDRALQAKVVSTACRHPGNDSAITPNIRFEPNELMLSPGEQATVLAVATIDDRMEPGVAYNTTFAVPGLAERVVHVVLRRRASATDAHAPTERIARKRSGRKPSKAKIRRTVQHKK